VFVVASFLSSCARYLALIDFPKAMFRSVGFKRVMQACGVMAAGDILCQKCEQHYAAKKSLPSSSSGSSALPSSSSSSSASSLSSVSTFVDWNRTLRMTANAAFINTGLHFYFRWLDTRFIGAATQTVLKKLSIDQLLVAPTSLAFFMASGVYGKTLSIPEVKEKMREDYFPTLQANWMVWPAANFINFKFIPSSYRILYVASLGVAWNAYLSYITNREPVEHPTEGHGERKGVKEAQT